MLLAKSEEPGPPHFVQRYALVIVLFFLATSLPAWSDERASVEITSPLPVKNLYPPMLRFYEPLPSSATRPYRQSLDIVLVQGYSSVYQFDVLPGGSLLVDMEIYNLDLRLSRSVSENTELILAAPLYYAHGGFMDGFLHDYHSSLGLPNSGREFRPEDEFAYFYSDPDGSESWDGEPGWEVGNIAFSLRHKLTEDSVWSTALLAGFTLPTASRARGWGTGKSDIAIGAVASWSTGKWSGHVEGHLIHPFAEGSGSTRYRDYARLSTTLGYRFGNNWSLLGQIQGGNSPYDSPLQQLDDPPWQVSLGGRMGFGKGSALTLAFTEGITQKTTTDFTFTVGLEFAFDAMVP